MWDMVNIPTEPVLVAACFRIIGAPRFYDDKEIDALGISECDDSEVQAVEVLIRSSSIGLEDLFERFLSELRSKEIRRSQGMVFTPDHLVRSMISSSFDSTCCRVVDCGCGAGRFALHIAHQAERTGQDVSILAVDTDPLACLLSASAAALKGLSLEICCCDFLDLQLDDMDGKTLFIGNPPYIRHHVLTKQQKDKGKRIASSLGVARWSKLSGLHACFIVKCLELSSEGDSICFLTGAEWLDVKYGGALREAFLSSQGGGSELVLFDAHCDVFNGVMSTALISLWNIGKRSDQVKLVFVKDDPSGTRIGQYVDAERLAATDKWSCCFSERRSECAPSGGPGSSMRLGDLFSISRGVVTGCNNFFVLPGSDELTIQLADCFTPVIAHAREVMTANGRINPESLSGKLLVCTERQLAQNKELQEYLVLGEGFGVDKGYVASHRRHWWELRGKPAPIVSTYMARGLPSFALNPSQCLNLNTVHGLYPKTQMSEQQMTMVVAYLNSGAITTDTARVYHGGLCKFEPREMEQIVIPSLEKIEQWSKECHASMIS